MLCRFCQRMLHIIVEAKTVTQILFLSVLDHVQSVVNIVNSLLSQINLLRRLSGGVRNEMMLTPHLVLFASSPSEMMLFRFFASKDTLCERM